MKRDTPTAPIVGTQTLLRGLAVLDAVAQGACDLRSISAGIGMTRSTTHRLASSLLAERFLRVDAHDRYALGPRLIELGTLALLQTPLAQVAEPHLARLAEQTGDTVHFGVRDQDDVLYLAKIPSPKGLEMRSRVGQRMPLAVTGIGKALMLDLAPEEARRLFDAGIGRTQNAGAPDWTRYIAQAARYRKAGCAFDLEENETGIRCVAAPVRDAQGRIVAAVSVASTVNFMPMKRMRLLAPQVCTTAHAVSLELGWVPATAPVRAK